MNRSWRRTAIACALFATASCVASVSIGEDDEFTFKKKRSDATTTKDDDTTTRDDNTDVVSFYDAAEFRGRQSEQQRIANTEKLRREFAFKSDTRRGWSTKTSSSGELPPEVTISDEPRSFSATQTRHRGRSGRSRWTCCTKKRRKSLSRNLASAFRACLSWGRTRGQAPPTIQEADGI